MSFDDLHYGLQSQSQGSHPFPVVPISLRSQCFVLAHTTVVLMLLPLFAFVSLVGVSVR